MNQELRLPLQAEMPLAQLKDHGMGFSCPGADSYVKQMNNSVESSSYTDLRSSNVLDSENFLPLLEQQRIYLRD